MTDTHTFKPDYLCDPPCAAQEALRQALVLIKDQSDEIVSIEHAIAAERERCAEIVEAYCALLNISQGFYLAKEIRKDPDYIDTDFVATAIELGDS